MFIVNNFLFLRPGGRGAVARLVPIRENSRQGAYLNAFTDDTGLAKVVAILSDLGNKCQLLGLL